MRRFEWTILSTLFCIQAVSLYSFFRFDIYPFPPEASDQAAILTEVYRLVAAFDAHGVVEILRAPFAGASQGILFPVEGAILEIMLRQGRLSVLLLNFLALIVVEIVLFRTVRYMTSSVSYAFGALGLFLGAHSLWFWAGGLFDFRIDWLASCLFGVWACAVLRSGVFWDRRWALISACVALLLILTRYITSIYIFGVEIVLLVLLAAAWPWFGPRRLFNGLTAAALTLFFAAPFGWASITPIYNYYVVGHLTGSERHIREAEFGVSSLREHLLYYPHSIFHDHLGAGFGVVLGLFALGVVLAASADRVWTSTWKSRLSDPGLFVWEIVFLLGAVMAPIAVLTTDLSKSPVVGSIVDVPTILFLVLLPRWMGLVPQMSGGTRLAVRRFVMPVTATACVVVGLGVSLKANAESRRITVRHDLYDWGWIIADVSHDAIEHDRLTPKIFFNYMTPHFNRSAFTSAAYEMTGRYILFDPVLQDSIMAPDPAWVMEQLKISDYVVLSSAKKIGVYPAFEVMTKLDPEILTWTESHLKHMKSYSFDGGTVDVFTR